MRTEQAQRLQKIAEKICVLVSASSCFPTRSDDAQRIGRLMSFTMKDFILAQEEYQRSLTGSLK